MFTAAVKPKVFCILFIIAAFYNLDIKQIDIKTAFLYVEIDKLLFVEMPKNSYDEYEDIVWRLNKAFYGLKQLPYL